MKTEQLIRDIFQILAFVLIFFLRVIVGSVKLAFYVYRSLSERAMIQESELITISEPVTELLTSEESIVVRKKLFRVVKLVFKATAKSVIYLYTNAPIFYQEAREFSRWCYNACVDRFAPKTPLLEE